MASARGVLVESFFHEQPREAEAGESSEENQQQQRRNKSSDTTSKSTNNSQKIAARARHRLWSIYRDAQAIRDLGVRHSCTSLLNDASDHDLSFVCHALQNWKVIANERCGSWYVPPAAANDKSSQSTKTAASKNQNSPSCYFKSTDGHVNIWEFSLKRLNLPLLERVLAVDGGCLVVDSSVRKLLPDSFSRTIPIWATVLNRAVLRYSRDSGENTKTCWDTKLYTPKGVVSVEEHAKIAELIDDRVETLVRSGAIVNPARLTEKLTKPLRVVWMSHTGELFPSNCCRTGGRDDGGYNDGSRADLPSLVKDYFVIACCNPSRYVLVDQGNPSSAQESNGQLLKVKKHQNEWVTIQSSDSSSSDAPNLSQSPDSGPSYFYTPGAADDHESWARHLTASIFWRNREALLNPNLDDDGVDALIDVLVQQERKEEHDQLLKHHDEKDHSARSAPSVYSYSDQIGDTNLWIGSRRAGRPPDCWTGFDAVLNVTNEEYDGMVDTNTTSFYLQLPVEEGKRDRSQLERWMPVGLTFLIHHVQQNRRVLVHCAQGKDRSVAVALIFVIMACTLRFPLRLRPEFIGVPWDVSSIIDTVENDSNRKEDDPVGKSAKTEFYLQSGVSNKIVTSLLEDTGKEVFLLWIHKQIGSNNSDTTNEGKLECLADKETVRIALHLIRQDRDVAEPTRSTMQKINRFLMSSTIYR